MPLVLLLLVGCFFMPAAWAYPEIPDIPPEALSLQAFGIQERLKDVNAELLVLNPEYARLEQKIQSGTAALETMQSNTEANARLQKIMHWISVQKKIGARIILLSEEKYRMLQKAEKMREDAEE